MMNKEQPNYWIHLRTPSNKIYYFNKLTKQKQFKKPDEVKKEEKRIKDLRARECNIGIRRITGSNWAIVVTNLLNYFYFNFDDKSSHWDCPTEIKECIKVMAENDKHKSSKLVVETQEKQSVPEERIAESPIDHLEEEEDVNEDLDFEVDESAYLEDEDEFPMHDHVQDDYDQNLIADDSETESKEAFKDHLKTLKLTPYSDYNSFDFSNFSLSDSTKLEIFNDYCSELKDSFTANPVNPIQEFRQLISSKISAIVQKAKVTRENLTIAHVRAWELFQRENRKDGRFLRIPDNTQRKREFKQALENFIAH